MLVNAIVLAMLIAIAVLLAVTAARSWRSKNRLVKWGGTALAAVLTVAVLLPGALMAAGMAKLNTRSAPVPNLAVARTPERIARGRAVVASFCDGCHTRTGPLTGGVDLAKDIPIPLGSLVSANLTPAGRLRRWSDGELFRAIRNSVDADGNWLILMSYTNVGKLSDDDIQALIAYLRSQPAAGEDTGYTDRLNPLGLIMLGGGLLPSAKPVFTGTITAPPKGATVQYGEYILSYQDCRECHGADLNGGVQGQLAPLGPGLSLVKEWSLAQFIATMRTGVDPDGHKLGKQMPWEPIGKMDDEELGAMYAYLAQMPDP